MRLLWWLRRRTQAGAVPVDTLLSGLAEVVPEMPSVSDLEGLRGAAGGAFGVEEGTVPADDLDFGPFG